MFFFNEKIEKVYLDKDTDYVFCYLKKRIITEPECDMYEHNKKCYDERKILNMTHTFGSNSGRCYAYGGPDPILNSCRYCLDKDKAERYWLPEDAIQYFNPKKTSDNTKIILLVLIMGLIIVVIDIILIHYLMGGVL